MASKVEASRSGVKREYSSGSSRRKQTDEISKIRGPQTKEEISAKEEAQVENILKGKQNKAELLRQQGTISVIDYVEPILITREMLTNGKNNYTKITRIHGEQSGSSIAQQSLSGTQMDPSLGPSSLSNNCSICYPANTCPGHMGYIDLGDPLTPQAIEPYIHPHYIVQVKSIYNIICKFCGADLYTEDEYNRGKFASMTVINRLRAIEKYIEDYHRNSGGPKCSNVRRGIIVTKPIFGSPFSSCSTANVKATINKEGGFLTGVRDPTNKFLYSLFSSLDSDQLKRLGFTKVHPKDLILSFITVIPPFMRDYSGGDAEDGKKDEFEKQYIQLIKDVNLATERPNKLEDIRKNIHDRAFHLFSSKKGKSTRRSATDEGKGYKEKVSSKEGLIRENMTGKRIDRSARAVADGDNTIRLGQIGVPEFIWSNSTDYLPITKHTREYIIKLYKEGALIHYVPRSGKYRRQRLDIKQMEESGQKISFRLGDEVTVALLESRYVIVNRNPSIHKVSKLAMKLVRKGGNSIRTHNSTTTAFNLDYDGDELNLDFPRGHMELAEARYLLALEQNIVNTENSAAIVGFVLDGVTAMYYLTSTQNNGYISFSDEVRQLCFGFLSSMKNSLSGLYRLEERLKRYNISPNSSRGILSSLFPPTLYYSSKNKDGSFVLIKDGVLVSGNITAQQVGPTRNSIAQVIYNNYSPNRAMLFINDGMAMCDFIMSKVEGLSIGFEDAEPNNKLIASITSKSIESAQTYVDRLLKTQNLKDPDTLDRIENEITSFLQSRIEAVGIKTTKEVLSRANVFKKVIAGGAKGNLFHLSQMITNGGQQFELGNRIMLTMSNKQRVSAYEKVGDTSIESRGYITNSLGRGFNPREEFYHHIASRVSLVDTATKTVDVGEYHHLQNKALQDLYVTYNLTLNDHQDMIVQYMAGGHGLDLFHMVNVPIEGQMTSFNVNMEHIVEEANSRVRFDIY